jgi:outer membrane protein TolC
MHVNITYASKQIASVIIFSVALALGLPGSREGVVFAQSSPQTQPIRLPASGRQAGGVGVQQSVPVPSGASTSVQVQVQGPYAGSALDIESNGVPDHLDLTLAEAIRRGLATNLGVIGSAITVQQAEAQRREARSRFLPSVSVNASENAAKVNLAAEGFSASAFGNAAFQFPATVGPFHYYDLHGALQQSILDLTAVRNYRAQTETAKGASLQSRQAREEVVLAVTGVYLQLMSDIALLDRQRAEVAYAEATYRQARVHVDAGIKAPLEASRSLVELQTEKQRLRSQTGQVQKRKIQLSRLIGLPAATDIRPQEQLAPVHSDLFQVDQLVKTAWSQRQDLKAAETQVRAAEEARKAASAQRLPSASINGTFGVQGTNPNHGNSVFQASATLSIPVFQGGRIEADVLQADAVVRQRKVELADQREAVEADVRTACIDLQVANDQVLLADSNRQLATQTLQQSQDRFSVGVADSVEVVNSQQALATADQDYISSLFGQHVARIALAHAMGEAEKDVSALFERKT